MKLLIQRSKESKVTIDGIINGKISHGLVVLVSFTNGDTEVIIDKMIEKLIYLRIFEDEKGLMNLSLIDTKGEILSISQFTLYADLTGGRRPSFSKAMDKDEAIKLYDLFNKKIEEKGIHIEKGIFGADMKVEIYNDGPITIMIDSEEIIKK